MGQSRFTLTATLKIMTSLIQPLPAEVVAAIAAGEVIDSPAAAVRELVENALDAGATRIAIALSPEHWRVRVADNGWGMAKLDLEQAATPHSTSKIHHHNDLGYITTLGFRGEALHSLAQLADLEICSRPSGDPEGWRVLYNSSGVAINEETVAIAPGTVVCVSNLFQTRLSRRQSLPPLTQQLKAIQQTIHHIALCYPQINWQITLSDRPWFTINPGTVQQIIPQLIRDVRFSDLQSLKIPIGAVPESLELVLGLPDRCHRRRADWIKVATNGRIVDCAELQQAVLSAMARTLPRDRYPLCFLHLQLSPNRIDWNRHPAKSQIYLHEIDFWQEQVKLAITQALRMSPATLPEAAHQQRVTTLLKAAETPAAYNFQSSEPQPNPPSLIALKALAQVHNTYILAEHPSGMWLIEQHIAHERILYEQLCDNWQLISLESPIILPNLKSIQLEQLERLGIIVEPFGEQIWAVRTLPALLQNRSDCAEAILELSLGGDLQAAQVAVACRSALRNGTPLTLPEMQNLLDEWKQTRNPRTCPHGRPIYLSFEENSLARSFRRHWVIGKSHGI